MMLTSSVHPDYDLQDWEKYRATYAGGRYFINRYLHKFPKREDDEDFKLRKELTYCPAFAEEAVTEIRNAIVQRMPQIKRQSTCPSYMRAIEGLDSGVDLEGSSMNAFIGQTVLPELMVMGKVGIFVDMPQFDPASSLAQFVKAPRPYLYAYQAEDIMSWNSIIHDSERIFLSVLVRENSLATNEYGLPTSYGTRFRYMKLTPEGVVIQVWRQMQEDKRTTEIMEKQDVLKLDRIPFILGDLGKSLLRNVADYQIALLNIESSDVSQIINANYAFYVEPYDSKADAIAATKVAFDEQGNETVVENTVSVGPNRGRKYPVGANAPEFIHPSSEPLRASMDKAAQIKNDIRQLMNLNVTNVAPSRASADAKRVDLMGLESGLSNIGLELQGMERAIASLWCQYMLADMAKNHVKYPENYEIKSDDARIAEAKGYDSLKVVAPSRIFAKEMSKKAAHAVLSGCVTQEVLAAINAEIDTANFVHGKAEDIAMDVINGLVTTETASRARGYDGATETEKAAIQHTERLARTASSQSKGVPDLE